MALVNIAKGVYEFSVALSILIAENISLPTISISSVIRAPIQPRLVIKSILITTFTNSSVSIVILK